MIRRDCHYKKYYTGQETQVWLKFAFECDYMEESDFNRLTITYDNIIGKLVNMGREPEKWTI